MKSKTLIGGLVFASALCLAGNAAAVTYFDYSFTTGAVGGPVAPGLTLTGVANTLNPTGRVDGYSQAYVTNAANATAIANNLQASTATGYIAPDSQYLEAQTISYYGSNGFGIQNKDACPTNTTGTYALSTNATTQLKQTTAMGCDQVEPAVPEHALDNNQRYEMALLNFGASVRLTSLQIGYLSGDADITVMAWMGSGAPTLLNGTTTWSTLGSGWQRVMNYNGSGSGTVANPTTPTPLNTDIAIQGPSGNFYSNYWLIGAYNPLANPNGASNGGTLTGGDDNFKLSKVTGCIDGSAGCPQVGGQVPEPGSLALLGGALLGMVAVRRRKESAR